MRLLERFRVFFPSWQFFEDPKKIATLCFLRGSEEWQPILFKRSIRFLDLFFSPETNYAFAEQSLIDRAIYECQSFYDNPDGFAKTITYQQLQGLVQKRAQIEKVDYEFKIVVQDQDLFVSGRCQCS